MKCCGFYRVSQREGEGEEVEEAGADEEEEEPEMKSLANSPMLRTKAGAGGLDKLVGLPRMIACHYPSDWEYMAGEDLKYGIQLRHTKTKIKIS